MFVYFAVGFIWMIFCMWIAWELSDIYSRLSGMTIGALLNLLFWPISMIIAMGKIQWTIEEIKMARSRKKWK